MGASPLDAGPLDVSPLDVSPVAGPGPGPGPGPLGPGRCLCHPRRLPFGLRHRATYVLRLLRPSQRQTEHGPDARHGHGRRCNLSVVFGFVAIVGSFLTSYTADKYDGLMARRLRGASYFRLGRDVRVFVIFLGAILN